MVVRLGLEYFGLVFVAALGVIQATVAYNRLIGLSFFGRVMYGYIFAVFTTGPALAGLLTWNLRNAIGVIEGAQQFGLFSLAVAIAVVSTLVFSSASRYSKPPGNDLKRDGLEAFRSDTFFQVLRDRFGKKQ